MNDLFAGVLSITIAFAGFALSWLQFRKGKYDVALVLLVLGGFVLRAYTSSDLFLHYWDERYHALVAKNLMAYPFKPMLYENPLLQYDFRDWTQNHIWLHKQPLPLWMMACSMWLFGVNEVALRLPSLLMSTAGIALTYAIGRHLFDRRNAWLAAFLFAINGLIIEISAGRVATDHIDIAFLFFIQLSIYFSGKYAQSGKSFFNVLTGIGLGAAILSKWLPALIVLPLWLFILMDSGHIKRSRLWVQLCLIVLISMLVVIPWQWHIFNTFPREAYWESGYNIRHLHEALESHEGPFYYFADKIRINYGELIYLPLLWFLYKIVINPRNLKLLAVASWFFIPFIFFSFAKTKMQGYLLFTSPALFYITAYFFYQLVEYKNSVRWKWGITVLLILLIALPVRYSVERIKPFANAQRNPKWVRDLRAMNDQNIDKGVLFNYDNPIEAMFYTNLTAYASLPDPATIVHLINEGYTVIVNDNGHLPENIQSMPGIVIQTITARITSNPAH